MLEKADYMTLKAWLKGLAAAVISGVSNAVVATIGCNATGSPLNYSQIGTVATTAALIGAALYLKQSPLPDDTMTVTTTATTTVAGSGTLKPSVDSAGNVSITPGNPTTYK